jgi:hypothetical protein
MSATVSLAQDTVGVGTIRGQLAAGRAAAGDVAVCIRATGQCTVSDSDGRFVLSVRPGTYVLEIVAPGAPLVVSDDIQVRAGIDTVVEVGLPELEQLTETVTVTAPAVRLLRGSGDLALSAGAGGHRGQRRRSAGCVSVRPGAARRRHRH